MKNDTLPKSIFLPSIKHPSAWRGFILIAAAGFVFLSPIQAVIPAPDGGYPGGNTAEGEDGLFSLDVTNASLNTAMGWESMFGAKAGDVNTAFGAQALLRNSGNFNTGIGGIALAENAADYNTAIGYSALWLSREGLPVSVTGGANTASGAFSLASDTSGFQNTANGFKALTNNTTGFNNTASGLNALFGNISGSYNTANGVSALLGNTTGTLNTATGFGALAGNTKGSNNTASGNGALASNITGNSNTADGDDALFNTKGSSNIALGASAGKNLTGGSNNIDIGNLGVAGESKVLRMGTAGSQTNAYIAGIYGVTASQGVGVFIDSTGHLGTTTSSARFKDAIKPMGKASEAILALQPVTFHYKRELDPKGAPQFGLVAEQVAKVDPDLIACDEQDKPYTVRYEAVNAMLLNEFLKEHRKVKEQARKSEKQEALISDLKSAMAKEHKRLESTVAQQESEIRLLTVTLKEQAAQIKKVSAELQRNKPAPRVVVNDR